MISLFWDKNFAVNGAVSSPNTSDSESPLETPNSQNNLGTKTKKLPNLPEVPSLPTRNTEHEKKTHNIKYKIQI